LVSDTIIPIEGIPDNLSCGQVQWHPAGDSLAFVGWQVNNRRLGIIHCFNRPSGIYTITFNAKEVEAKLKEKEKEKENKDKEKEKEKEKTEPAVDNTVLITKKHPINRSPRYASDGTMIYLAADQFDSHNSASKLCEVPSPTLLHLLILTSGLFVSFS